MVEYEPLKQQPIIDPDMISSKALFNKPRQEQEILKELFDFENDIDRLVHVWNGNTQNYKGDWILNKNKDQQMMNEKGIHWCKSKLKSFACKFYVVTSFDNEEINNMMRLHCRDINHELSKRYEEFGFQNKLDIKSVWSNMINSILAIFKGSFGNAQRQLLSTTNQYSTVEHKDTTPRSGWFGTKKQQQPGGGY